MASDDGYGVCMPAGQEGVHLKCDALVHVTTGKPCLQITRSGEDCPGGPSYGGVTVIICAPKPTPIYSVSTLYPPTHLAAKAGERRFHYLTHRKQVGIRLSHLRFRDQQAEQALGAVRDPARGEGVAHDDALITVLHSQRDGKDDQMG